MKMLVNAMSDKLTRYTLVNNITGKDEVEN